jgi:hypothetical protein
MDMFSNCRRQQIVPFFLALTLSSLIPFLDVWGVRIYEEKNTEKLVTLRTMIENKQLILVSTISCNYRDYFYPIHLVIIPMSIFLFLFSRVTD